MTAVSDEASSDAFSPGGIGLEHRQLLLQATEALVVDYAPTTVAGVVIAAVARAKCHVRDGYTACGLHAPPADEYVSLIIGLARHELNERNGARERRGRPIGMH